jgi:hypothetical protein
MTSPNPRTSEDQGYERTKTSEAFENGRSIPTPCPRNPRNKIAAIGRTTTSKTASDAIHRITTPGSLMKFT